MANRKALPIVIVGAGLGGLSAAIHLAAEGEAVTVFEQNDTVGGKMRERRDQGFYWGRGPSVLTMRHVLEDLFTKAGRHLEDYLTLKPLEPMTRYFYPDGTTLDLSRQLPRTLAQLAALDVRDVEGYLGFLTQAARLHRIVGPVYLYGDPPTLSSLMHVAPRDLPYVDGYRTMSASIRRYAHSPYLRQLLGRFATYVGGSPYRVPAPLNTVAHVELNQGIWYPEGGMYRVADAYRRLAEELGVEIHTGARVARILVEGARAQGVVLEDGRRLPARAVVANVDVATVYRQLLPEPFPESAVARRLLRREPSSSGFVLHLGIEGRFPQLLHHNIFFSTDYRKEFDDLFRKSVPPEDPTLYVSISAKSDPQHAPDGCENWFVLINAPSLSPRFSWEREAAGYRDRILARLAQFGYDVRGRIRSEHWITPDDLQAQTGAWRGALYGASLNSLTAIFARPHNRAEDVKGLYFTGGTTHPGGGVPMVTLSGAVAARMLRRDTLT